MLPSKFWESAEIGVGRNHGAAVFDCNRRVLGVSDQLPGSSGLTAQPFEYVQMIGPWTNDARGRAFHERGDECEGLVESGWGVEDSRISYDADEAGQNEDGEGEGFRSCRQTSDPRCILGVFGNGVLDVGIYQNIHVGKQHPESPTPLPETGLRHPVRRAPSVGRDRFPGGGVRPARSPAGREATPTVRDASERPSNVLAIKELTLMPRASAARRTCFASWSSREIVVLMMH